MFELPIEAAHYLRNALRLTPGQLVAAFDGLGCEWKAEIDELTKRKGALRLVAQLRSDPPNTPRLTLNLALLKGPAMDNALQKATELGVDAITLVQAERSNVSLSSDRLQRRMDHWLGVLASACEQSGRTWLPTLSEPVSLAEAIAQGEPAAALLMDLGADTLKRHNVGDTQICIGPEGGWTQDETDAAVSRGAHRVSLSGGTTMRADTAAAASLVAVQQIWGWPARA